MTFSKLKNLVGILLGAVSLVMLVTPVTGVQFQPWFAAFLSELQEWYVTVFLFTITPLAKALVEYLSFQFDWRLTLAPWWHHAFVLLWLLIASWARNYAQIQGTRFWLFTVLGGGAIALAGAIVIGTVPLNSAAILMYAIAGVLAFFAIDFLWDATEVRSWLAKAFQLFSALLFASASLVFARKGFDMINTPAPPLLGFVVPSPGLVLLALGIAVLGVFQLLIGFLFPVVGGAEARRRGLDNPFMNLGLDILGAFGFASFLAVLGASLPG